MGTSGLAKGRWPKKDHPSSGMATLYIHIDLGGGLPLITAKLATTVANFVARCSGRRIWLAGRQGLVRSQQTVQLDVCVPAGSGFNKDLSSHMALYISNYS